MKIRRGPKSTGDLDLTDERNLKLGEWAHQQRIVFDINKGYSPFRNSIVEVEITEADVDTLYRGLEESRRGELLILREQVKYYRDVLHNIQRIAMLQPISQKEDFDQAVEDLARAALAKY